MASTGEAWRLGRRPALDGVRALAVALVVLTHARAPGFGAAGLVGVTVFFALSGFLITTLLLEEHDRAGRVDLPGFFRRRARRLFPAAGALVMVVALAMVLVPYVAEPAMLFGTVTYSSNWLMASGVFAGGALIHTWSLAIEEQFYLLWPVVMLGLLRLPRRWVAAGLLGAALALAGWRVLLLAQGAAVERVYYGSDTRADALLFGCGLAFALSRSRVTVAPRVLLPAGLAALVVSLVVGGLTWAPLLAAVATLAVVYAVTHGRGRWLAADPLVWLGRRSYGLYLWHLPVMQLVYRTLGDSVALAVLIGVPLSLLMAEASWRFVEQPFLRVRDNRPVLPHTVRLASTGEAGNSGERHDVHRDLPAVVGAARLRPQHRAAGA